MKNKPTEKGRKPIESDPSKDDKKSAKRDRELRDKQKEKEIDKTIADSFPASDPPGNY